MTDTGQKARRGARRADSILVYGQQKTGTTGMYNTVKAALAPVAPDYFFSFEPASAAPITSIWRAQPDLAILAKVIAHRAGPEFPIARFERRVMMVRDPRDTLISNLLFKPLIRSTLALDMELHDQFIAALEAKEADPGSISVTELLALGRRLGYKHAGERRARRMREELIATGREHGFHNLRYERFVDGDLAEASDYLGLDLRVTGDSGGTWLDHISRSRDYGAWRHWFTPSDVDRYRPRFAHYLTYFGYGDDWDLSDPQAIDPATSSQHVRASLARRRAETSVARSDEGDFDLRTHFTMAEDGSVEAAIALARHLLSLDRGYLRSARYWVHRAELQGSAEAAALGVQIDRQLAGRRPITPIRARGKRLVNIARRRLAPSS